RRSRSRDFAHREWSGICQTGSVCYRRRERRLLSLPGNIIESSLPFVSFAAEKIPTLGHNLALVSVLYLRERPEITSHDEATEGQNKKEKNMKTRTLKQTCSSALIVMTALTVAFSFASAQAPERTMSERTIQGAWRTMVT